VVARGRAEGTHAGVFMGIAPTGNQVRWTFTQMFRVRDERLAESWMDFDLLGILDQIGAGRTP
jgi:predicted ester cyclase